MYFTMKYNLFELRKLFRTTDNNAAHKMYTKVLKVQEILFYHIIETLAIIKIVPLVKRNKYTR